jgi:hypothetical protein
MPNDSKKTNNYETSDQAESNKAQSETSYQTSGQGAAKPISKNGAKNNGSRKKRLTILDAHPEMDREAVDLHRKHRANMIGDGHVDDNPQLTAHYAFLATIDPSSATFDPPDHDVIPMPMGGLPALATHLLGPVRPDATVEHKAQYKEDHTRLQDLLFRLNSDTLRNETSYRVGALVRVPNERA